MHENSSHCIRHEPCPACGSRDNLGRYSDGHGYCFGCGHYEPGDGEIAPAKKGGKRPGMLPVGEPRPLPARGLTLATCERWGYTIGRYPVCDNPLSGQLVQIASFRDPHTWEITHQHIRGRNKEFAFHGDGKEVSLWGWHLWKDGGKRVIITEGQLDAMSVDQVLGYKWQVLSLPNGVKSAKRAIARDLSKLTKFDEIVFAFDMDAEGRACVAECAPLIPPGKLFDVTLPLKDANDMLQEGRIQELVQCLWNPKSYRPDGIVTLVDVRASIFNAPAKDLDWFLPSLDRLTYGRRYKEATALGAGTGIGKTTFMMQQVAADLRAGHPSAVFAFETSPASLIKRVAGINAGKKFHIPGAWTHSELAAAVDEVERGPGLYLYDHHGVCEWKSVRERIRHLTHCNGVRIFWLDHLTALAAMADDEKKTLEQITAEMSSLVQELDIWLGFISHLATPEGTPHEEGGRVKIRHFKGSRAIGYWAHNIIGLERDSQAEDRDERSSTVCRILKCREHGDATGETVRIAMDNAKGRLVEAPTEDAGSSFDDVPEDAIPF
jgi:twinkle protein